MAPVVARETIQGVVERYDRSRPTLAAVGSHSCLDVCDGGADEGIRTLALCQEGREAPYTRHFRTIRDAQGHRVRGCVDDAWVFPRFDAILDPKVQERLRQESAVLVPNRSLTSYCNVDAIERDLHVPMFGSRSMLRVEERGQQRDYYWLLEEAGLPFPEPVDPQDIDGLVIVKLHHAQKKLERGFFTAASRLEYLDKAETLVHSGVITREDLAKARIERYVIGPVFNFDFFWSPLSPREEALELLGVDYRFESSLDGQVRIPAPQQMTLPDHEAIPEMTVVGHAVATIRESLLGEVFGIAERFVDAAREHFAPGIIGPFTLQTCVDKDMKFWVYDVAPRLGGGTNVHVATGHPYGNMLWRRPMSTGRRIAMEVKRAAETNRLRDVVT